MSNKNLFGKNRKNRVLIYSLYDKDGIVDDYVEYILSKMQPFVRKITVIVNGRLSVFGRKRLNKIANNIIVRENKGFDIWGYKIGMDSYSWEKLLEFDEIILMNDTIFGPIDSFDEMFETMDKKDLDFWGITIGNRDDYNSWGMYTEYGYIPEHIQSYFYVIKKHMFSSLEFKNYFNNLPQLNTYIEAVTKHEVIFTKKFNDYGFSWGVYVNSEEVRSLVSNPLVQVPYKLVKEYKCPIFKRKSFCEDYKAFLGCSSGEWNFELVNYIKENSSYDIGMVYKNILRISNHYNSYINMHHNFILPSKQVNYSHSNDDNKPKVALMLHLYYADVFEKTLQYARNMPEYADIYISTQTHEKKKKIESLVKDFPNKVKVDVIENRGRDVSALTVAFRKYVYNYDIVCFAHDEKVPRSPGNTIVGFSHNYMCYENILATPEFIENVIQQFKENKHLGLLVPPPSLFADYYVGIYRNFAWGDDNNFNLCIDLAKKLNLKVDIDKNKMSIAPYDSIFWFRVDALKPLFNLNLKYEDFPEEPPPIDGTISHAIERIQPFIAQSRGYYSARVLSDKFARMQITNLEYILSEINKRVYKIIQPDYFIETLHKLDNIEEEANKSKHNEYLLDKIYKSRGYRALLRWYQIRDRWFPVNTYSRKFIEKILNIFIKRVY